MPNVIEKIASGRNEIALWNSNKYILNKSDLNEPVFSVVIPIYDRTDLLRCAIESILSQTFIDFELILVLDGSPPETRAVVEEFSSNEKVRIFSYPLPSGNAVRPRNKGILEARGKYIAFLDSDDLAETIRLAATYNAFQDGADVVYGAWRAHVDGSRNIEGLRDGQIVMSPQCDLDLLSQVCVPCQSTVSVRRDLFYQAGFLKPVMQYREDHELWARLAFNGAQFKALDTVLTTLRIHKGNNELNFKDEDHKWEKLFGEEFKKPGPIPRKIVFIVDGFGISGGLSIIMKHATALFADGHDLMLLNVGEKTTDSKWWPNNPIPMLHISEVTDHALGRIDMLFATFWTTAKWLERLEAERKLYFMQSDERLFYDDEEVKTKVADTYNVDYEYVVIAEWIRSMLHQELGLNPTVIPNGIDLDKFYPDPLLKKKRERLRVLLEGPIGIPMKGLADAYAAVADLDCDIWIVSSTGKPQAGWRYSEFFEKVPVDEMRQIYSSCDILVKMSRVESFCLPALEAMACGCCVVVSKVSGGIEYLVDKQNALIAEKGDIAGVRNAVSSLLEDESLRDQLVKEGLKTASEYSFENSKAAFKEFVTN